MSRARSFLSLWSLLGCVWLLMILRLAVVLADGGVAAKSDFRAFYSAGYLLRVDRAALYDLAAQQHVQDTLVTPMKEVLAFYHPGYEALVFAPLSLRSYRWAFLTFAALNAVLLLIALRELLPSLQQQPGWLQTLAWVVCPLFMPALIAILHGQDSILLFLAMVVAWRELRDGNDFQAGCVLALGLFKFQIVLPIALLLAVRQGWKFVEGFGLVGSALALLSVALTGIRGAAAYVQLLSGASSAIGSNPATQVRLSVFPLAMPNVTGMVYLAGGRMVHAASSFDAICAAVSLCILLGSLFVVRRLSLAGTFALAVLCGLAISYHLYIYDLTLVLIPLVLLECRLVRILGAILFIAAAVVMPLGSDHYSLLAIPVLLLLVSALVEGRQVGVSDPAASPA